MSKPKLPISKEFDGKVTKPYIQGGLSPFGGEDDRTHYLGRYSYNNPLSIQGGKNISQCEEGGY